MTQNDDGGEERTDSMCAFYADIIEHELESENVDMGTISRMLDNIREYCQTVGFAPGETPEHLEEYQFEPESERD